MTRQSVWHDILSTRLWPSKTDIHARTYQPGPVLQNFGAKANPSKICLHRFPTLQCKKVRWLTLKNAPNLTYLGVNLDRTKCLKDHLKGRATKLKSRDNSPCQRASVKWDTPSSTHYYSLALPYSAAEYCAYGWSRSLHTHNHANHNWNNMFNNTPLDPRFIKPCTSIWHAASIQSMLQKVEESLHLPLHGDNLKPPSAQLPSRWPIYEQNVLFFLRYLQFLSMSKDSSNFFLKQSVSGRPASAQNAKSNARTSMKYSWSFSCLGATGFPLTIQNLW